MRSGSPAASASAAQARRFAEAHDPRDVEGPRAEAASPGRRPPFCGCRRSRGRASLAHVERAHALGSVHLVGGKAHEVHGPVLDRDRDPAHGLDGVAVEDDAALAAERADLGDRLERAHLVVRRHERDEDGVGAERAATSSAATSPTRPTATRVTSKPSRSSERQGSRTAACSMDVVTMCRPRPHGARAAPRTARLSDSVAPDVKTISSAEAPTSAATCARASSTARCASWPKPWLRLEGLPNRSVKNGSMAASTAGSHRGRRVVVEVDAPHGPSG